MSEAARLFVLVDANVTGAQAKLIGVQGTLEKTAASARRADKASQGFGRSFSRSLGQAAGFGSVYAAARGVESAVKGVVTQTVGFDRGMRNVNSIAQLSERQFGKLETSVRSLATQTAQSPQTLADGLYDIVSSGFQANDALKILRSGALAASAGLTDTKTATSAVTGVLNAYHLKAKDAAAVSDDLFQTVNLGVLSFEQLAAGIGPVLPFAARLGVNLKQLGGFTATLTKAGVPARQAFTDIKGALSALIKPTDELKGAYKELGVTTGSELIRKTGSVQAALEALYKTTGGSATAFAKLFPDLRGLTAALGVTGKNAGGAARDLRGFVSDTGATAKALSQQRKSVGFQFQQLKADVSDLEIKIGGALIPTARKGAEAVIGFVRGLETGKGSGGAFADDLGRVASTAGKIASAVTGAAGGIAHAFAPAVGPVLAVGKALGSLALDIGKSKSALTALGGGFLAFKAVTTGAALAQGAITKFGAAAAFARTPLGAVAIGAALLGAALLTLGNDDSEEAALAKANAAAHRDQADAIKSVQRATEDAANKGLAAQRANNAYRSSQDQTRKSLGELYGAQQKLNGIVAAGGKGTSEYRHQLAQVHTLQSQHRDDLTNEKTAFLDAKGASNAYGASVKKQQTENAAAIGKSAGVIARSLKEVNRLQTEPITRHVAGKGGLQPVTDRQEAQRVRDVATAQKNANETIRENAKVLAVAATSELSRQRLMDQSTRIQAKYAQGVADLIHNISNLPKSQQASLLLSGGQSVLSQLGQVSSALNHAGRSATVSVVIKGAASASAALAGLQAIQKGVKSKVVTSIEAKTKNAYSQVAAFKALAAGVPASRVLSIIAHTSDAQSQVAGLVGAIAGVQSKSVTITTTYVTNGAPPSTSNAGKSPAHTGATAKAGSASSVHTPGGFGVLPGADTGDVTATAADVTATAAKDKSVLGLNPTNNQEEYHTASEWRKIRTDYRQHKKHFDAIKKKVAAFQKGVAAGAKAAGAKVEQIFQSQFTLFDVDQGAVNVLVAQADLDGNVANEIGQRRKLISADMKRINAIKAELKKGGLTAAHKNQLQQQLVGLLGDVKGLNSDVKDLSTPDLAGFIQAVADAKAAADQATQSGFDARLIQAQLNTPKDTTDDQIVLTGEQTYLKGQFDAAIAAGDNPAAVDFGQRLQTVNQALDDLTSAVKDNTDATQAQIDLMAQQLQDAQNTAAGASAQVAAITKYMVDQANGQIGGKIGLGFQTSVIPGRLASY